ncbi:hypothetical protein RQP46_006633 [Phenoliferia psychrophenolica]
MLLPTILTPVLLATLSLARETARPESPRAALFEVKPTKTGSQLPTIHFQDANSIVFQVEPDSAFARPDPIFAEILSVDNPNFGSACQFVASATYLTCGDYLHLATGVDHALFCSPRGVCAGELAACGSDEACDEGLSCNSFTQRCAKTGSFIKSINAARLEQRRKTATASGRCPELAEACSTGSGGFECVQTLSEVKECGGCLGLGGRDCSKINNALSSSCREGACVIPANPPLTASYLADFNESEQSLLLLRHNTRPEAIRTSGLPIQAYRTANLPHAEQSAQLLAACNAGASARQLVSASRAQKARKDAGRVDFSDEVGLHRDGIEDGYGKLVSSPDEDEESDEDSDEADSDDEDAPPKPPKDRMKEVIVPNALEQIEGSFEEMIGKVTMASLYKTKKNAVETGLGIATAILDSQTELAEVLRRSDRVYKIMFDDGLATLLEKCSEADLATLETDGFLERLMEIDKDNGDVHLQLHLLPVLTMFLGL